MTLNDFIGEHRADLINRCVAKVAKRSAPQTETDGDGVPVFLDQLCQELVHGPSPTHEISKRAMKHGHDLMLRHFTISQVVHGYGDVCQSITDLAVELSAPIENADFRTLNRCLDDAIAGAVTQFSEEQDNTRDGEAHRLRHLVATATVGFEALRSGKVGLAGSTAKIVAQALKDMGALTDRQRAESDARVTESKPS